MENLSVIYWHFLLKNQHCCTQKTKQGKSRHHRASNMDWGHFKALFLSLWSSNFPSQKWKKKLLTLNEPRFPIFHSVNMLAWQKIILSSCILWFGAKRYFNNANTYIYCQSTSFTELKMGNLDYTPLPETKIKLQS